MDPLEFVSEYATFRNAVTPCAGDEQPIGRDLVELFSLRSPSSNESHSTRRYARPADNAMIEVLRSPANAERQASDNGSGNETEQERAVGGGPSRTRTWDRKKS